MKWISRLHQFLLSLWFAWGDGVNSIFFSNRIFGNSFGEGTLAITVLLSTESQVTVTAEADVVVNSGLSIRLINNPRLQDVLAQSAALEGELALK